MNKSYGFENTKLWEEFIERMKKDENYTNISNVKAACVYAENLLKETRRTFYNYTLHDQDHSVNVLNIMSELLGDKISNLTDLELALLILSALYHDIGMVYSLEEKDMLLKDSNFIKFLNDNPCMFNQVYDHNHVKVPDEIAQEYFRSIHQDRVWLKIPPDVLWKEPNMASELNIRDELANLCASHGYDANYIKDLEIPKLYDADIRFCAIILRLSDILDFDTTRAPDSIYSNINFNYKSTDYSKVSDCEWKKHSMSKGFKFPKLRNSEYELIYGAECKDINVEILIRKHLDLIDIELSKCKDLLKYCSPRWQYFTIPSKVNRSGIKSINYTFGNFKLTLDENLILKLLVGNNIYENSMVFVRELIQNAFDTTRTRKIFENDYFTPIIDITSWVDDKGYCWFRIDDNGMGMDDTILLNYFLKIGSSYYLSQYFESEKKKHANNADVIDFTPISCFGIGILSCFLVGDRIEVSTKHHSMDNKFRLSINGLNGYYMLCESKHHHDGLKMPSMNLENEYTDKNGFRLKDGTSIAVRVKADHYIVSDEFEKLINDYIKFCEIPVYYNGKSICTLEKDFLNDVSNSNDIHIKLNNDHLDLIRSKIPLIKFTTRPEISLECVDLRAFSNTPYLSGAFLIGGLNCQVKCKKISVNNKSIKLRPYTNISCYTQTLKFHIHLIPESDKDRKILDQLKTSIDLDPYLEDSLCCYDRDIIISDLDDIYDCDYISNVQNKLKCSKEDAESLLIKSKEIHKKYLEIKEMEKGVTLDLVDLSEFSWYKHFSHLLSDHMLIDCVTEMVHNGIALKQLDYINSYYNPHSNNYICGIILFKDLYCPQLDISRRYIKGFTLDASVKMDQIFSRIGKIYNLEFETIEEHHSENIKFGQMRDIFIKFGLDDQLLKDYIIYAIHGDISIYDFKKMLLDPHSIYIMLWMDNLSDATLNSYIIRTLVQMNFTVYGDFDMEDEYEFEYGEYEDVYIEYGVSGVVDTCINDKLAIFPPMFFIYGPDHPCACLCSRHSFYRYSLNMNHQFSKWLISNGDYLNSNYPEIFSTIVEIFKKEDYLVIIERINTILLKLKTVDKKIPITYVSF